MQANHQVPCWSMHLELGEQQPLVLMSTAQDVSRPAQQKRSGLPVCSFSLKAECHAAQHVLTPAQLPVRVAQMGSQGRGTYSLWSCPLSDS